MKFFLFLIFIIINQILSQWDNEATPCERNNINNPPEKFEDCLGKSCEFIEEICCYLESINATGGKVKECIDFQFYDYSREDLKKTAIEKIKNGTYWDFYKETYDEIVSLKCNKDYLIPPIFLLLFFYFFL